MIGHRYGMSLRFGWICAFKFRQFFMLRYYSRCLIQIPFLSTTFFICVNKFKEMWYIVVYRQKAICQPNRGYPCASPLLLINARKEKQEKTQNKETGEGKKTTVQITSTMLVHRFVPIVDHVFVS